MSADPFLDTNILIYAFANGDPRASKALSFMVTGGTVSVQVLNEFVNVSRKRLARTWSEIERELAAIRTLLGPPLPLRAEDQEEAVRIAKRYNFGIYDSMMVASAIGAGCTILYTEDLHHGQKIGALTVRNPFKV